MPHQLASCPTKRHGDDHEFSACTATVAGERLQDLRSQWLEGKALKNAGDALSHDILMSLLALYRTEDAVLSRKGKGDKARLTRIIHGESA